jgi:hypothetical protein
MVVVVPEFLVIGVVFVTVCGEIILTSSELEGTQLQSHVPGAFQFPDVIEVLVNLVTVPINSKSSKLNLPVSVAPDNDITTDTVPVKLVTALETFVTPIEAAVIGTAVDGYTAIPPIVIDIN